jgi:hypothetical protein
MKTDNPCAKIRSEVVQIFEIPQLAACLSRTDRGRGRIAGHLIREGQAASWRFPESTPWGVWIDGGKFETALPRNTNACAIRYVFDIRVSEFDIVSDFGIRISDFRAARCSNSSAIFPESKPAPPSRRWWRRFACSC